MPPQKKDNRKEKNVRITDETFFQLEMLRHPYSKKRYVALLISREYHKRIIPIVQEIDRETQAIKKQITHIQGVLA